MIRPRRRRKSTAVRPGKSERASAPINVARNLGGHMVASQAAYLS